MTTLQGDAAGDNSIAVTGNATGKNSTGVFGEGELWGVRAEGGVGIRGEGKTWNGVEGVSHSSSGGFGVFGTNDAGGTGVAGVSTKWIGVYGETSGIENGPAGVWGEHKGAGNGVRAISNGGEALVAVSSGKAGVFHGNVDINGLLAIKGTDFQTVLDRLTKLEALASEIKQLEDKVSQLAEKVVSSVL